jgi:hypothetical protein
VLITAPVAVAGSTVVLVLAPIVGFALAMAYAWDAAPEFRDAVLKFLNRGSRRDVAPETPQPERPRSQLARLGAAAFAVASSVILILGLVFNSALEIIVGGLGIVIGLASLMVDAAASHRGRSS